MNVIGKLFGRSPFGPIANHMERCVASAENVPKMVDALLDGRLDDLAALQRETAEIESEADTVKNDLRSHLPRKLFLPVDRRDLLELLDLQDTIADRAEDVGDLLVARTWVIPDRLREPLRVLAVSVTECAQRAGEVTGRLEQLEAAAFGGPEVARVEELIDVVNQLEDAADDAEAELNRLVFEEEEALGALGAIMWLRLTDTLGDVADYGKKSCNRLRLLIAR